MEAERERYRRLLFLWRGDARRLRARLAEVDERLRELQEERDGLLERVTVLEEQVFEESGRQVGAARRQALAEHLLKRVWAVAAPH
eukprot:3617363-Prorocentrum_lima.AAC.1